MRRHSQNLEMASHFLCDYTPARLSSPDRRILDFAVQVTQEPSALTEDDVDQIRDAGLDEPQILAVVLIACLSNFMDRLANILGRRPRTPPSPCVGQLADGAGGATGSVDAAASAAASGYTKES